MENSPSTNIAAKKEASEVEAKFKELDKDSDGKLSAEEYAAGAAKAPKK